MKQAIANLLISIIEALRVPMLRGASPAGILKKSDVCLFGGNITVRNIPERIWKTTVANTDSMLPVIDYGDIAILTNGFDHSKLAVGDIVVYEAASCSIIHRIVAIDESEEQRVYTCKGDHCTGRDPYQILDEQVSWLLVGIVYCKKTQRR